MLVSSATVIAFIGVDATEWWIMIVPTSSWVFCKFLQQNICPLKISSEAGSFSVTVCVRIVTLQLQQCHWKPSEFPTPYFQQLSVSRL